MRRQDEESSQEDEYEDRSSDDDEEEYDEYDEHDSEEYSDEDEEDEGPEVDSKRKDHVTHPEASGGNSVDDGGTECMDKSSKDFHAKRPEMPAIPMGQLVQKASSWSGPRSTTDTMEDAQDPVVRHGRPALRRRHTDEPKKTVRFAKELEEVYEIAALMMDEDPEDPEDSQFHQLTDAQRHSKISTGDASRVRQPAAAVQKASIHERPSVKQSAQNDSKPAALDKPKVPETLKQASLPPSVRPPNPEKASAVDSLRPPLQRGILQPFAARSGLSTESQVQLPSNPEGSSDPHFLQRGLGKAGLQYEMSQPVPVMQASKVLQESPKFGNDMTDALHHGQPRIERGGSLPEPFQRPRIGILKKAKTESYLERPKTLRFAAEVEIREISPVRRATACSPPALTQAVVVGTPVDPGSVQWLQQLGPAPLESSCTPGPTRTETLTVGSATIGRSQSLSLLPELPERPDLPQPPRPPREDMSKVRFEADQTTGASESQATVTTATSESFKVQVQHQVPSRHAERCTSSGGQASESGFLIWKAASACEPQELSTDVKGNSDGKGISHSGIPNPFARMAQYFYQITQPAQPEEAEVRSPICDPLPMPADHTPVLQTTVNCLNELTEMYTRHRHRSRKSHKHREKSHPNHCGRENIPVRENIDHGTAYKDYKVDAHRLPPDFEKRVLERAYFQYINGVSEDQAYNYAEALRIELGQRPDL